MTPFDSLSIRPPWMDVALPRYGALGRDLKVDVAIVGGGLTGITTAYLLANEGVRVALIDRDRLAAADTAHTTAHLTYVTDYRLHELVKRLGIDGARAFWATGAKAIDSIEAMALQTGAECDFQRVPGYLHDSIRDSDPKEMERLTQDCKLANTLGFDASFIDDTPHIHLPGVRFAHQAKFHPRKYLKALLHAIPSDSVFEHTELEEVESSPFAIRANGKRIRCDYLVMATHSPLMGMRGGLAINSFQDKLTLYTSYVLGARLPKKTFSDALFWDTGDPYDYLRIDSHRDYQYAIFGGEDAKAGNEGNADAVFDALKARFATIMPEAEITHRWLGQLVVTDDGLPFIGEYANRAFIATGFCGNGFTIGTASAMMARDRFLGRENICFDLFRVDRNQFHNGVWRYVRGSIDIPKHLDAERRPAKKQQTKKPMKRKELKAPAPSHSHQR